MRKAALSTLITMLLLLAIRPAFGDTRPDHRPGHLIVWLEKAATLEEVLFDFSILEGIPTALQLKKLLIPGQPIFLLQYQDKWVDENALLAALTADQRVHLAQFDHFLQSRSTVPDDSLFSQQWNFLNPGIPAGPADIDLDLAWDITTGGTTYDGHPVVVAVIDDGIDPDHPDVAPNLWYNTAEIPLNGLDDDNNGYTDDYAGWNVDAGFDLVQYGIHGQQVAGLIGARGNNQYGISGVNWEVDLMPIVGISGLESEIVEAYGYALNQRMLFQQTNGTAGALVACTNTSWGVDQGNPDDFPIWCALFDLLGQNGILSVAATTNADVDVDSVNDMPTSCGSAYLISVTATDAGDERNFAGYGVESVDLAAPGEDVLTTDIDEAYTTVSGTSFAAPQVAGLVALLYAVPCEQIAQMALNQPTMLAAACREAILNGVDPVVNLVDEVATGGRLNAFKSLQEILQQCDACLPPAGLQSVPVSDTSVLLQWVNLPGAEITYLQWRHTDSTIWQVIEDPSSPYLLSGLQSCAKYEFRLNAYCSNETSGFSAPTPFSTPGCCEMPANFVPIDLQAQAAALSWDPVYGTDFYLFRYREAGTPIWTNLQLEDPYIQLTGLPECLTYETQVIAKCGPDQFSDIAEQTFTLPGCNSCLDQTYCETVFYSQVEWIESFSLDGFTHNSGNNGGYAEFTDTGLELAAGSEVLFSIEPGFADWSFFESYLIWLDLDQDGQFEEPDELLYGQSPFATDGPLTDTLHIPSGIPVGTTRMRVMQIYTGPYGLIFPFACTSFGEYGEVEDYCVTILDPGISNPPCTEDLVPLLDTATYTTLTISWSAGPQTSFILRYRPEGTDLWTEIETAGTSLDIFGLQPCVTYEVQLAGWCNDGSDTGFSFSEFFSTPCNTGTIQPIENEMFIAFPNPFTEVLFIRGKPDTEYQLQFFGSNGIAGSVCTLRTNPSGRAEVPATFLPAARGAMMLRWSQGGKYGIIKLIGQ